MTKIKLCGLTMPCDIEAANQLRPEYIGFVFAKKSRRYVSPDDALELRKLLCPEIQAVGVFVNEEPGKVAELLERGIIDLAQLHGNEDEDYIRQLKALSDRTIIQAFRIDGNGDIKKAESSSVDYILLDTGSGGTGMTFDWRFLERVRRPYFLAGGLNPENVRTAIETYAPYAVDVSSGIETNGIKDKEKMKAFVRAVQSAAGKGEHHDK